MNKKHLPFFVRAVEGAGTGGSAGTANTNTEDNNTKQTEQSSESGRGGLYNEDSDDNEANADDADDDEDSNEEGRGSKRAVLADLARERKKRHAAEDRIAELEEAAKGHTDSSEQIKKLEEQVNGLIAERRKLHVAKALADAGLPAEMADRVKGDTLEELQADAEEVAKLFRSSGGSDPTQGRGGEPKPTTFLDALERAIG